MFGVVQTHTRSRLLEIVVQPRSPFPAAMADHFISEICPSHAVPLCLHAKNDYGCAKSSLNQTLGPWSPARVLCFVWSSVPGRQVPNLTCFGQYLPQAFGIVSPHDQSARPRWSADTLRCSGHWGRRCCRPGRLGRSCRCTGGRRDLTLDYFIYLLVKYQ